MIEGEGVCIVTPETNQAASSEPEACIAYAIALTFTSENLHNGLATGQLDHPATR